MFGYINIKVILVNLWCLGNLYQNWFYMYITKIGFIKILKYIYLKL